MSIMSTVIGVEFDSERFPNKTTCLDILSKTDWNQVLKYKSFKLTQGVSSQLSYEKRNVWKWSEPLWEYPCIRVYRPGRYMRIIVSETKDRFSKEMVPPPSLDTVEKERQEQFKKQAKLLKDEDKKAKRKLARAEAKRIRDIAKAEGKELPKAKKEAKKGERKTSHLFGSKRKAAAALLAAATSAPPKKAKKTEETTPSLSKEKEEKFSSLDTLASVATTPTLVPPQPISKQLGLPAADDTYLTQSDSDVNYLSTFPPPLISTYDPFLYTPL